jgi:hypothetical protein
MSAEICRELAFLVPLARLAECSEHPNRPMPCALPMAVGQYRGFKSHSGNGSHLP